VVVDARTNNHNQSQAKIERAFDIDFIGKTRVFRSKYYGLAFENAGYGGVSWKL